jgi:hypothetical protein
MLAKKQAPTDAANGLDEYGAFFIKTTFVQSLGFDGFIW